MASAGGVINDQAAVLQALAEYYIAFSTREVQAILPSLHEPALIVGAQGVFAANNRGELETAFARILEGLRVKGYGRSEFRLGSAKSLSETDALVTGVAVRYKLDGQELEQAGVTYAMHKADGRWKIAVLIVHDVG